MINTTICSIAIGKDYQDSFYRLIDNICIQDTSHNHEIKLNFLCATDTDQNVSTSCKNINIANDNHKLFYKHGHRNEFNFNLKYIPIAASSLQENTDCIIFVDSDWQIHDNFKIDKVRSFIDRFMKSNADFIFERPHPIGGCKKDSRLFWRHKVDLYNLKKTDKYDNAHVVNEQFLAFKNNNKMHLFIDSWQKRNIICLENGIRPWAEGVEIGMSYTDANMIAVNNYHKIMSECFQFQSKDGKTHVRW
tara:strand:+ start:2464 stop:3207 length:744 start_codon:yes stop_codon:yes gene_type:complete